MPLARQRRSSGLQRSLLIIIAPRPSMGNIPSVKPRQEEKLLSWIPPNIWRIRFDIYVSEADFFFLVSPKKRRWETPLKRGSLDEVRFFTLRKDFPWLLLLVRCVFFSFPWREKNRDKIISEKKKRIFLVNFKWGPHRCDDSTNLSPSRIALSPQIDAFVVVKSLTDNPPSGHLRVSLNVKNRFSGSMSNGFSMPRMVLCLSHFRFLRISDISAENSVMHSTKRRWYHMS